jgi:hypothetical protein
MLAISGIALRPLLILLPVQAQSGALQSAKDNQELNRLCEEDQSDRTPPQGKSIDMVFLGLRDKARLKRVKELYTKSINDR